MLIVVVLFLVVVDNLDAPCFAATPNETDPPLNIDPDAVLALAIAGECFQTIARRGPHILQRFRGIDHLQLCPRPTLYLTRDALDGTAYEDGCGPLVGEASYHK
jgi:hypothetical protein